MRPDSLHRNANACLMPGLRVQARIYQHPSKCKGQKYILLGAIAGWLLRPELTYSILGRMLPRLRKELASCVESDLLEIGRVGDSILFLLLMFRPDERPATEPFIATPNYEGAPPFRV